MTRVPLKLILQLTARTGQQLPADLRAAPTIQHPEGTELERTLATAIRRFGVGLPPYVREFTFDPERNFKTDFAWPEERLLVECEGADHKKHDRYQGDLEKYNRAALLGYRLLRCNTESLDTDPVGFVTLIGLLLQKSR